MMVAVDEDDFAIDIDADDSSRDYTPLIKALRDEINRDETADALIEACETAIELDKGEKNEQAALKALSQISAKAMAIDVNAAGKTTLPAMLKHIETIRNSLNKIEAAVALRQNGCSSG